MMNVMDNDTTLKRLLALLQHLIFGYPPETGLFEGLNPADWEALYLRAAKEGVLAESFDSIIACLPQRQKPPHALLMKWVASIDAIERRYFLLKETAAELEDKFADKGFKMYLFKGIQIAKFHPVPEHREFGDIDIYVENFKESVGLLKSFGATLKHATPKHTSFIYKGVMIELHRHFLTNSFSRGFRYLDDYLLSAVKSESNNFIAIHFISHAIQHFMVGLRWRYFLDWALILHSLKGKLDLTEYDGIMSKAGCKKVADALTAITVDYLKLPIDEAPPFENDKELTEKILKDMQLTPQKPNPQLSFFGKCRMFIQRRWRYGLVSRSMFWKALYLSLRIKVFFRLKK
jgi:hypothetical protein